MSRPDTAFRDPLAEVAVRQGHRELLAGYREFLPALREACEWPEPTDLRAAVSFLRHAIGGFARWEEGLGEPTHPASEATAFEHAFIAAETERVAAEVGRLLAGERQAGSRVRWHADRIEAALELHVARVEEDPVVAQGAPPAAVSGPQTVVLEDADVDGLLAREYWGVLSTIGEEGPYAVPVSYAWSEGRLFVASGPGRKLRNLERNPVGCLSVVRVDGVHRWISVTVEGRMRRVTRNTTRARALRGIRRQRSRAAPFRAEELRRALDATVFEIEIRRIGGRACGAGREGEPGAVQGRPRNRSSTESRWSDEAKQG